MVSFFDSAPKCVYIYNPHVFFLVFFIVFFFFFFLFFFFFFFFFFFLFSGDSDSDGCDFDFGDEEEVLEQAQEGKEEGKKSGKDEVDDSDEEKKALDGMMSLTEGLIDRTLAVIACISGNDDETEQVLRDAGETVEGIRGEIRAWFDGGVQ